MKTLKTVIITLAITAGVLWNLALTYKAVDQDNTINQIVNFLNQSQQGQSQPQGTNSSARSTRQ